MISAVLSQTAFPLSQLQQHQPSFCNSDIKLVPTSWPLYQLALLPEVLIPQIHTWLPPAGHVGLSSVTTSLTPLPPSHYCSITAPCFTAAIACIAI